MNGRLLWIVYHLDSDDSPLVGDDSGTTVQAGVRYAF